MAIWLKKCTTFKEVRNAINEGNLEEIHKLLLIICDTYAKEKWEFAEDFERLRDDIEPIDTEDEEEIDYCLHEFYDLCDNARVWLEV